MSFILDALKKSENERQRQSGPAVFEVKVAKPKTGLPVWAFALAGLLAVNLGVVIWLLLRSPSRSEAAAAIPSPTVIVQTAPPPAMAPMPLVPAPQPQISPVPPPAAASDVPVEGANSEDYEPAVEPEPSPAQAGVTRGTVEGLQTYEQVAGTPGNGLPELRLDLHVFAVKPQERFVLVNMHRLREGDSLPEGVRVESITPDGAVLAFRGAKFVLERD